MSSAGTVRETYHAAIQHDLVDLRGDEHLAGVARRPTAWFRAVVDANYPELGPPDQLLEETKQRQDDMQMQGMCEEGAHNAAWETVEFARRYREYVEADDRAQSTLADLAERVRSGEDVVLVCFEAEGKRCHRHLLQDRLAERVGPETACGSADGE
jgi:uncharacterized protein YeaO (DUF488 family)